MSFQDYQGGFTIDDIDESAKMPEQSLERPRIKVPPGTGYNVMIKPPNFSKAEEKTGGYWMSFMVLEVIDGPYAGGAIFINIWHNNQHDAEGKKRDGMTKREIAQIAKAVGVTGRLDDIGKQLGEKTLTCDYVKRDKSEYCNPKNYRPLGAVKTDQPATQGQTQGPTKVSDEIPF